MASSEPTAQPVLRILGGSPTAEEIAVIVTVMSASGGGGGESAPTQPRHGRWNDPAGMHTKSYFAGPGVWLASAR